jgi:hypothetical protein
MNAKLSGMRILVSQRTDTYVVAPAAPAHNWTLASFVLRNRVELEANCRAKAATRHAPLPEQVPPSEGVSPLLQQLVEALEFERRASAGEDRSAPNAPAVLEIGTVAAVHGAALWHHGCSVDDVVHDYGDVCQSITELAGLQNVGLSADEFRILNGCLDDAIAHAVTAYQNEGEQIAAEEQAGLNLRLQSMIQDHQRLVRIAHQSFLAIQSGNVGATGATGTRLAHALDELSTMSSERLPQVAAALSQRGD